jgi:hypothetical protein
MTPEERRAALEANLDALYGLLPLATKTLRRAMEAGSIEAAVVVLEHAKEAPPIDGTVAAMAVDRLVEAAKAGNIEAAECLLARLWGPIETAEPLVARWERLDREERERRAAAKAAREAKKANGVAANV